ncbi:type IV toxin-antitoxin system AbiEi family antitoxin domain-containing protein [Nocardia sp. NPDC049220]|uniref:type IV toxin-antitoxin system AbiEi family antitoxin domain-containing protein n=1 Tax=Nocardia sp. NPDC049220 TaxID=3155273 RepID=UPI00340288E6
METPQLISRQQALAAGLSDKDLRRLCRTGRWQRLRAGHYLDAPRRDLDASVRHQLLAIATAETTSESAITSHCSAAVLHGMSTWDIPLDRVHLTRDRINGGRMSRHVIVHAARLEFDEITIVHGISVTTAARTVIDVARSEGFEQSVALGDSALRHGLTSTAELQEHLRRARHRPGCRKAGQVVQFLDGRSASVGESRSRIVFHRGGLPSPDLHARVFSDDGICVGRVDFLFPDLGVIGEFRNALHGPRSREQVAVTETKRDGRLHALGWMVVRWTWDDLADPTCLAHRIHIAAQLAGRTHRRGHWTATPQP